MPKVSVYLPDELYRAAQERKLPLSALTQAAVERALRTSELDEWVQRVRALKRPEGLLIDSAALLAEVREEFGE
jgi:post-segregation antitoxin (ccd killing protein)